MAPIRRAVLSVFRKDGLVELGTALAARGVELIATGGTAAALVDAGVAVTEVEQRTGFPSILGGRVKTLHPAIAGGILARRDRADDRQALEQHGIDTIDLVVVDLYPFEQVTAEPGCTRARAVENIDIGGPTMIRAAAKNHAHVAVIVDPADYPALLAELDEHDGAVSAAAASAWATKAFYRTAAYDAMVAGWLAADAGDDPLPERVVLPLERVQTLRYGENPHQRAALYAEPGYRGPSVAGARQLGGKALSYNNLADADAALALVREFDDPAAVIVKHTNPCGAAVGGELHDVFARARATDPMSAFGGIVALNRPVDLATAEVVAETFFEVVLAPGFDAGAAARLTRKKALRVLELPSLAEPPRGELGLARIRGGYLRTEWDDRCEPDGEVATARAPNPEERAALAFAWRLVKHVRSNAIVLARRDQAVGIGAGQMSRVDSVELAVRKAQLPTAGSVLASDAFFPFRDGLDAAAAAGVTAVIQPGGSVRDAEVVDAANEHGLAMIFTGMRHFRH